MTTLSVVIPYRNEASRLGRCVASIAGNAPKETQFILVDDASTDSSPEAAQALQREYGGVELVRNPQPRGAGACRNAGLDRAKHEYVLFFDADDTMPDGALTVVFERLVDGDFDFAIAQYELATDDIGPTEGMHPADKHRWAGMPCRGIALPFAPADRPFFVTVSAFPWTKITRRSHLVSNSVQFSDTAVHNDLLAHWQIYCTSGDAVAVPVPLCRHIDDRNKQRLTTRFDRSRLDVFRALQEVEDFLKLCPRRMQVFHPQFLTFQNDLLWWVFELLPETLIEDFHQLVEERYGRLTRAQFRRAYEVAPNTAIHAFEIHSQPRRTFSLRRAVADPVRK